MSIRGYGIAFVSALKQTNNIPLTWYTIKDVNNQVYVHEYDSGVLITDKTLTVAGQTHTGGLRATAIQSALDVAFTTTTYTVTYMPRQGTITI